MFLSFARRESTKLLYFYSLDMCVTYLGPGDPVPIATKPLLRFVVLGLPRLCVLLLLPCLRLARRANALNQTRIQQGCGRVPAADVVTN